MASIVAVLILLAISIQYSVHGVKIVVVDPDLDGLAIAPQPEDYQQRMVDWIRRHKYGFVHPSLAFKRIDGTGPYAIHTTTNISKGTKLISLPREYVIDSGGSEDPRHRCLTVKKLLDSFYGVYDDDYGDYGIEEEEKEKKGEQKYEPYHDYLFNPKKGGTTSGILPSSWSDLGKKIIKYIINLGEDEDIHDEDLDRYDKLRPLNFDDHWTIWELCGEDFRGGPAADPKDQAHNAYLFLLSRGWGDKMLPLIDMLNHRNGQWLNVELSTSVHDLETKEITAYAYRDIEAGEQLYLTYTECMERDCQFGQLQYEYTTESILMDFGFIEMYPRRWTLGPLGSDDTITVEIDEDVVDGGETTKVFKWIFDQPSKDLIEWVEFHLKRLKSIETKIRNDIDQLVATKTNSTISDKFNIDHEVGTITDLYEGYVELFQLATKHRYDPVSVTQLDYEKALARRQSESLFSNYDEGNENEDEDVDYQHDEL